MTLFATLNYLLGFPAITDEADMCNSIVSFSPPQSILTSYIVLIWVPSEADHETMIQV